MPFVPQKSRPGNDVDALVARRLAPERQAADYGRLLARIDGVAKPRDPWAVLACDACGSEDAIAVAFLDNAAAT